MSKKPLPPEFIAAQFKPGQSGNPGGMTSAEKKLLKLTKQEVSRLLNLVSEMTEDEMKLAFKDPKTRAIDKLFLKAVLDGIKGNSITVAEFILNRTIGKPKDEVQITSLRKIVKKLNGEEIAYERTTVDENEEP